MNSIGVCSWSLQPDGPDDLAAKVGACGLNAVQLALDPIRIGQWDEAVTAAKMADAGIKILSGMMRTHGEDYSTLESIRRTGGLRPDEHWPANLAAAKQHAAIASRMKINLVTFHAGFIPHDRAGRQRAILIDRLREVARIFANEGVAIALETGQETAATLIQALKELDVSSVGVNFDPANMILYGMGDPVEALKALSARVFQIHVKDACPSSTPGEWGTEKRVGEGCVDWEAFMRIVHQSLPKVDLVIERERGESTIADVRAAHSLIHKLQFAGA